MRVWVRDDHVGVDARDVPNTPPVDGLLQLGFGFGGQMGMRRARKLLSGALVALACAIAGGCATIIDRDAVPAALTSSAIVPHLAHARFWGDEVPSDLPAFIRTYLPNVGKMATARTTDAKGRPVVEYLAISGGAGDGAYGAGFLAGWTARGDRPTFEVVTGVSAGAIIAPFAFLGAKYDARLKEIWTQYKTDDIAKPQIFSGILGGSALADTSPLKTLIDKYVDRSLIDAVSQEYRAGRVLLVGTTNIDAQRPVFWNMGEIASSTHPSALELFRQVILASASIPGAFPPVRIRVVAGSKTHEEMHVDGGTTRQVFVAPAQASLRAFDGLYTRPPLRRIYIIKNGKLTPEYEPVSPSTISISTRSLFTLTKAQAIGDINRIWAIAQRDGAEFNLTSIPAGFTQQAKEPFDQPYMQALYRRGLEEGRSGQGWSKTPPYAFPIPGVRQP